MPMTTTEYQRGSSVVAMAFRRRSVLSLRRNQVGSMDQNHEEDLHDLDLFQSNVADSLLSLDPTDNEQQILSLSFLQKLLDIFLSCEDDFKNLLARNPTLISKSPVDRLLTDLLDRAIKSLDICNAVTHSLQSLRHWNRHADIAASALTVHALPPGEGQLNRARKALSKLLASSDSNQHQDLVGSRRTERAWSFCSRKEETSRSMARNWSAARQLQSMSVNLAAPRGGDAGGLASAVYTMSSVLVFTMWALVAAIPCQERGTNSMSIPVAPPRQLPWAAAMVGLQEMIAEELRRRAKKGGSSTAMPAGILVELLGVERSGRELMEAVAVCEGEGGGGSATEVVGRAEELGEASRRLEEGLGPFERQVREVFHRVVRSRAEVMRCLEQSGTSAAAPFLLL